MAKKQYRKIYDPPIESRDTDELIGIANSNDIYWQQEAREQAREELIRRNVPEEYEEKLLEKLTQEMIEWERVQNRKREANAVEKYTRKEALTICIMAPLILIGKVSYDEPLSILKAMNYKLKYRKRKLLLTAGLMLWIALFYLFVAMI